MTGEGGETVEWVNFGRTNHKVGEYGGMKCGSSVPYWTESKPFDPDLPKCRRCSGAPLQHAAQLTRRLETVTRRAEIAERQALVLIGAVIADACRAQMIPDA